MFLRGMCEEPIKNPKTELALQAFGELKFFLGVLVVNVIDRSRKSIGIDLDLKF